MIENLQPYLMLGASPALGNAQMILRGAMTRLRCAIESGDLFRIRDELTYGNYVESKYMEYRESAPRNSVVTEVHRKCGDAALKELRTMRQTAASVLRSSLRISEVLNGKPE